MNVKKERLCDLFCENFGFSQPAGAQKHEMFKIGSFDVMEGSAEEGGTYSSVFTGNLWEKESALIKECAEALTGVIVRHASALCTKKPEKVLVAALGNPFVAADSLGTRCAEKITATGGSAELVCLGYPEVYVIKTGVRAQSGLHSSELISLVSRRVKAELVFAIDSLAARSPARLSTVIQVSDAGITPGSGASSHALAVDKQSVGCPVITLGVPTVIRAAQDDFKASLCIPEKEDKTPSLYTFANIDSVISCYSSVLASALNSFFSGYCHK